MLKNGMVPDCFILLDVPQEVLVERVIGRRSDPLTGRVYHLKFNPPTDQQILQRLIQRHDDTAEVIVTRYRDYQLHTHEVRSYFEQMVVMINGNTSKESISNSILSALHGVVKAG
jgi:adenylate kinase